MKNKIIFLNGPSSSGKTTLAKKLQDKLLEPYLHIGIDRMIDMMPEKMNDYNADMKKRDGFYWLEGKDANDVKTMQLSLGDYAKQVNKLYKEFILCMAENKHNIIIDEVCIDRSVNQWRKLLTNFNAVYVGFKMPLEVLEAREKARGDRIIGGTREQYTKVHNDADYDIEITDPTSDTDKYADQIIQYINQNFS